MNTDKKKLDNYETNIAIIGLGYVGLPLAIEFGKIYNTVGFDINQTRIEDLKNSRDSTLSINNSEFIESNFLSFTTDEELIQDCNVYIVAVPTPLDNNNQPDLNSLKGACKTIGKFLTPGDLIIFESTVYPGATEEVCVPILMEQSNLIYIHEGNKNNQLEGFYCGYSPERFAPGEGNKKITEIIKVTSGSTKEILERIDNLYNSIIAAGTIKASSIKIAEAAKVIENTQRDLNIALVNEFALIFKKLDIDTEEILNIAATKWNYAPHQPGLVGGHCIGVDPYYLAHKAIEADYYPHLILSGRETNNKMGYFVAEQVMQLMTKKNIPLLNSRLLIMGFTFKENCADVRNTRVIDIIRELENFGCYIDVYDPILDQDLVSEEFGINLIPSPAEKTYDAIVLAVCHSIFVQLGVEKIREFGKKNHIIFDAKYMFDKDEVDGRL